VALFRRSRPLPPPPPPDDDRTLLYGEAPPPPSPPPAPGARRRGPRAPLAVRLVRGLLGLALLLAAGWVLLVVAIHLWGRRDQARRADAIVVLGAAQYDGRPSPVLKARLDHAIDLYRRGLAKTVIMTGGVGPGDTVSEATVSKRYAMRQGVPAKAILVETTGLTTVQSMRAVAAMMKEREMDDAVLVSDPFHMLRLKLLAWRAGITGYTSPTPTSPISRNRAEERKMLVRESFGLPMALLEAI